MKKIAVTMALACSFAFAQAQDNSSSVTGKWKIHSSIAGNDSDASCTFTQTNSDLTGTCPSPNGDVKLTGKVDGKKIAWSYSMDYNGSPLTMKYEGTLDAGKIAGTVTVDPFGVSGDFSGTQATGPEAAAAAPAPAAAASSLDGKWKIHSSIAGNDSDASCTFKQTNSDLSGSCPAPGGTGDVKLAGKVDGKKVTWSYNVDYNGSPLTMKYTGTLEAGKIAGDVSVEQYGVGGDFIATPEK